MVSSERHVAFVALEWFIFAMYQTMTFQVVAPGKDFTATRVRAHEFLFLVVIAALVVAGITVACIVIRICRYLLSRRGGRGVRVIGLRREQ